MQMSFLRNNFLSFVYVGKYELLRKWNTGKASFDEKENQENNKPRKLSEKDGTMWMFPQGPKGPVKGTELLGVRLHWQTQWRRGELSSFVHALIIQKANLLTHTSYSRTYSFAPNLHLTVFWLIFRSQLNVSFLGRPSQTIQSKMSFPKSGVLAWAVITKTP